MDVSGPARFATDLTCALQDAAVCAKKYRNQVLFASLRTSSFQTILNYCKRAIDSASDPDERAAFNNVYTTLRTLHGEIASAGFFPNEVLQTHGNRPFNISW